MNQLSDIVEIFGVEKTDIDDLGRKAFQFGELKNLNIPIPEGFIIKSSFFKKFLKETKIDEEIKKINKNYHPALENISNKIYKPIKDRILQSHLSKNLALEFHAFYRKLAGSLIHQSVDIMSSSKTNRSTIFKNVTGDANVVHKIKEIYADNFNNPVSVVVLKHLKQNIHKIITNNLTTIQDLTQLQTQKLKKYCEKIKKHFYFPMIVEFAIKNNEIIVVNLMPFTGAAEKKLKISDKNVRKIISKGKSAFSGIATGPIRIFNKHNVLRLKKEILVVRNSKELNTQIIKRVKGIIIDGKLSPALRPTIPTIENVKDAIKLFKNGNIVTINGVSGEIYSGGLL